MNDPLELFVLPIVHGAMFTLMAAFVAAPLALIVLVVDIVVGKRMAPRFRCLMWMLVVVRLVIPIAPESSFSVQNLWKFDHSEEPAYVKHVVSFPSETSPVPTSESHLTVSDFMSQPRPSSAIPNPTVSAAGLPWEETVVCGLSLLWFVGALTILFRAIVATLRFARQLGSIPCVEDQHLFDMLQRICDELDVDFRPQVKYVPDLPAPALFGLFRPTLCLPKETRFSLSDDQLRMILIHEVMHLRRRDGILSWLFTIVQAAHWFNPIAWFALGRVARYREQACDAVVRRLTAPKERHKYTDLLLQFASQPSTASLGLVGLWFAQPARSLTDRIKAFSSGKSNQTTFPRFVAVAIVGFMAIVGLTDAVSSDVRSEPSSSSVFSTNGGPAWGAIVAAVQSGEADKENSLIEERVYDLTQAVKKLSESRTKEDAKRHLLAFLKSPMAKPLSIHQSDNDTNQLKVLMTRQEHDRFTNILSGISRSGPWQVTVEIQTFCTKHLETIQGIDWQDAIKFALPAPTNPSTWPQDVETEGSQDLSLSVESVSYEYAPYVAVVLEKNRLRQLVEQSYRDPETTLLDGLKVTMFNRQKTSLGNESLTPFITGVHYVQGKLATAATPDIVVLPKGMKMDIWPQVINKNALDFQCRLTAFHVEGVSEAKLPGQDIVVQVPRTWRKTISARCQLKPGQTLLIAPTTSNGGNEDVEFHYYVITPQWFLDPIASFSPR